LRSFLNRLTELAIIIIITELPDQLVDEVVNLWVLLEAIDVDVIRPRLGHWDAADKRSIRGVGLRFARPGSCRLETARLGPILELVQAFLPAIEALEADHVESVCQQVSLDRHV